MRKTGICPKCNSSEIYTNSKDVPLGDRASLTLSTWIGAIVEAYVCLSCGFLEEYMRPNDLLNEKKIDKIRSTWRKI
jgi:Zn ribbon nucleic-acid-binding protein